MGEPAYMEPVSMDGNFATDIRADKYMDEKTDSRMHIVITDNFVKGYFSGGGLRNKIKVLGAVNDRNEMILLESENGKITRTFQGAFCKKGKRLILLSGHWKSTNGTTRARFSDSSIKPESNHPEAFSLISKKQ